MGPKLIVWNVADGSVLTSIADAGGFLGFDERGERLFTHSGERKLSVWRIETGDRMCEMTLPQAGEFMTVSISQDGTRIAHEIFASII
jgi:hypothetical protein